MEESLLEMTEGTYPFSTITVIKVVTAKPIIAPKYILYPETTETDQVQTALKLYGLK